MLYESEIYRRPYRATYTTSPWTTVMYLPSYVPSVPQRVYYRPIPKLSQAELIYRPHPRTVTRLVTSPEPPQHMIRVRVRPSIILRELDRIQYKRRPELSISAVDDFYREQSTKDFQDESRRIRADTASLLTRARAMVPRGSSVSPLDTIYNYNYGEPVPYRFSNDAYVARLLLPLRSAHSVVNHNVKNISFYHEPAKRFTGRGHLAAVHYSGKKAFSNRVPLYKHLSIRDDVNLLSFYAKNRLAACGLAGDKATAGDKVEQPTTALSA
ncbi:unnamed protein product [Plutella xylostella]|uniref:(diamondback moth) hypothetical protein n=1 Tax=Plutella xylostella TaxID=51655 RepID=A0A8S4F0K7_PLUXY|nr:unnamed protein product [Plutella xylostella]